jgi:hypothetical protein
MAISEWRSTTELVEAALKILKVQFPMTIRQLFYGLVSIGRILNNRASYQTVSRVMTKARNDGRCDFDWIVDRSRPEYSPNVWNDLPGYLKAVASSYRKDYWRAQSSYVEVWAEKDAIIGSIEELTNELGVTVRVGRGFMSTTKTHDIAEYFRAVEKPVTVLYLGDHDPSGRSIEQDVSNRVRQHGGEFKIRRIAILAADIKKFNLPPLRVKDSDSRTKGFLSRYSNACVELDALPPTELRRRIRKEVEALQDKRSWERSVAIEEAELDSIERVVSNWPTSPSL